MSILTAAKTAECLLAFCNEHGDVLTNLKLQRMLYYVQGWHLGLYGSPLFDEPFEAWIHGPVIPEIYRHYQAFGFNPIESDLLPGDELPHRGIEPVGGLLVAAALGGPRGPGPLRTGGHSIHALPRLGHLPVVPPAFALLTGVRPRCEA